MRAGEAITGWLPKGKVTEAMVETGYQALVDDYAMDGNTAGLVALELEWKGVPCHLCKTPYRKVEVRNPFGEFDYHVPNCRCFKSCPRCGRPMVEERLRNLFLCINCYGDPDKRRREEEVQKPMRGKKLKKRSEK